MSIKVFVISDTHYGLTSAGYDRTPEIDDAVWQVAENAIEKRADLFIHCGDLGHRNHPKPEIYARWLRLCERFYQNKLQVRFLVGNHDVIHDSGQPRGSLAPLHELQYHNIDVICQPKIEPICTGWQFLYLPYLSRSHIGINPNEYIDQWLKATLVNVKENIIVFAHLNVKGADIGNERIMRASNLVFPEWLCDHPSVKLVISGHIHLHQVLKDRKAPHVCIGSSIYTDFGDSGEKKYLTITIDNDETYLGRYSTNAVRLVELNYDLVGYNINQLKFEPNQVDDCIVKIIVRCTEAQSETIDWEAFKKSVEEHAYYVRPIRPIIVKEGVHQAIEFKPGLTDMQLVEKWLQNKKPPDADLIWQYACESLEKVM